MNAIGDVAEWGKVRGDFTHRLDYDLNENSVVIDLGGHQGVWSELINEKYKSKIFCFEPLSQFYEFSKHKFENIDNVLVFPLAISDTNGEKIIYYIEHASSMHDKSALFFNVKCITLDKIMSDNHIEFIDLIKFNIEGEEYAVLEYMIKNKLIEKCDNIQVQFHKNVANFQLRYDHIKQELEKTHELTYYYPFVWENWKKK